jgi:uncharacterized OsmC-like protein
MTTVDTPAAANGVHIDALLQSRQALSAAPRAAAFQWRARTEWVRGVHSRTTVDAFSGLGAEQSRRSPFVLETDHPELFHAGDNGATPMELVLAALAGCLTAGVASVASMRGVRLHSVVATVTAEQDLRGTLGIDPEVRSGFDRVRVRYEIDADAPRADVEAILAQSQKRSSVFDVLTNPVTVTVELA